MAESESESKTQTGPSPDEAPDRLLSGRRVFFVGKLGGMNRREALGLIREHGGQVVSVTQQPDLVVLGAEESPLAMDTILSEQMRGASLDGAPEIVTETELWERLGFVLEEGFTRLLYTPAMLADLLKIPVSVIRRWHRRGLIVPVREVHRLPYFDFEEVSAARHLAQLLAAGVSPASIEKKIEQLSNWFPQVQRPLAQLSIIVEGSHLLLRQGEGLVEATGQRRFDFLSSEPSTGLVSGASEAVDDEPLDAVDRVFAFPREAIDPALSSLAELMDQASRWEEEGRLQESIDTYRTVLAVGGPSAEVNFWIAELLYRIGDITAARERYYAALELDEDYVEARANLGCVLAETGELELAVAAFQGTLARHSDYPDVHYHLARTFDELSQTHRAEDHWREFLRLAADSPWAEEARDRMGWDVDTP